MRRRVLATLAATLSTFGIVSAAAPAWSYWSTVGTGTATGAAASLVMPAAPRATASSSSIITVSGTLPAGQLAGTTYAVLRGTTQICAPTTTSFSCDDTGLAGSTAYAYRVVAGLGAWSAASGAATATTMCSGPNTFAVGAPATVTAGTAFTVGLMATTCSGAVDTTYSGRKTLSWSGLSSSPNGTAPTYQKTVNFASGTGTATLTAVGAESTTLTASTAGRTGSDSITVTASVGKYLQVVDPRSSMGPVALSCGGYTANQTCSQTSPVQAFGFRRTWSAALGIIDPYGNDATYPTALGYTVTANNQAFGSGTVAAGKSTGPTFTGLLPWMGTATIVIQLDGFGNNITITGAG